MRASKWIALGLAAMLAAGSVSACSVLRTPYERTKIQEEGGVAKKGGEEGGGEKKEGEEGGQDKKGGKGSDAGSSSAQQQDKGQAAAEKKKADDKAPSRPGRAETKAQERERVKGQGLLYVVPQKAAEQKSQKQGREQAKTQAAKPAPEKPAFAHEADLSKQVARLEGVDGATVLLDKEHNAYVAMTADLGKTTQGSGDKPEVKYNPKLDVKTEGEIPPQLQEKTAAKLREIDPKVGTVHITADPQHVAAFQRYVTEAAKQGDEAKMNVQATAEHIQDIWK